MNIALIHFRVGETDGVSLEMDKWKKQLIRMNHRVYYIAGNPYDDDTFVIKELAYDDSEDLRLSDECFIKLKDETNESLHTKIDERASIICRQMIDLITHLNLHLIIPNNLFALAKSLAVAKGIYDALIKTGIQAICHHHDFYWERKRYQHPTAPFVTEYLDRYFPPLSQQMSHVVINSDARFDLMAKKGLTASIVPNVFDFEGPSWVEDDFNRDFLSQFHVDDSQIVFLQATRVVNRKAIELTIDLIDHMNRQKDKYVGKMIYDGRTFTSQTSFVLLCVGLHEGIDHYEDRLISYAHEKNVRLILDPTKVSHTRKNDTMKSYALWDAYVHADIISYPSIYEGFGNQFLEALFARKPLLLFEYKVFEHDIKHHGFSYASLGNTIEHDDHDLVHVSHQQLDIASKTIERYLFDRNYREQVVKSNFILGKRHYGMDKLYELIGELLNHL